MENIADYLLYWMNRHKNYSYVNFLGLDSPSDDIREVLIKGSVYLQYLAELRSPETGTYIFITQLFHLFICIAINLYYFRGTSVTTTTVTNCRSICDSISKGKIWSDLIR